MFVDNSKYEELATTETWTRFSIEIGLDVFTGAIVKLIKNECDGRIIFWVGGKEIYDFSSEKELWMAFLNDFRKVLCFL